jgi:hypothetical protein
MTENNPPKKDRIGADYREGPNANPGGEIDIDEDRVPPYDGRTTSMKEPTGRTRETVERHMEGAEDDSGT